MGTITVITTKDLVQELQQTTGELPDHFRNMMEGLKEDYSFNISAYVLFREGNLAGGHIITDEGEYGFFFDNEMSYYPYVILGTQAHWIGSPVMIDGSWVYIGMHPGTAPYDYMEMAFDATEGEVDSRIDELGSWIVG